jgi:hypothetical protein
LDNLDMWYMWTFIFSPLPLGIITLLLVIMVPVENWPRYFQMLKYYVHGVTWVVGLFSIVILYRNVNIYATVLGVLLFMWLEFGLIQRLNSGKGK